MTSTPNTIRDEGPESTEGRTHFSAYISPELIQTVDSLENFHNALIHETEITATDAASLITSLNKVKVRPSDEYPPFTVEEVQKNMTNWQAVLARQNLRSQELTFMTPEMADQFVEQYPTDLHMALNLTLTKSIARAISRWEGRELHLGTLTLTAEAAAGLADWSDGSLSFYRLTTLDVETARALARSKAQVLIFDADDLSLDEATAREFLEFQGRLIQFLGPAQEIFDRVLQESKRNVSS